jgi:GNAT superfamily N-acetyltransferase
MNLTIDNFRGSAEELNQFVVKTWESDYAGKMIFPRWTTDYFQWQFRLANYYPSHHFLAAYDGDQLAGVLLGTDYPFRTASKNFTGSQWSWLTIHPNYRGHGIATLLDQERVRRLKAVDNPLIVSFRYVGSQVSKAERPRKVGNNSKFLRKIGFWSRVLRPGRFSRWHVNALERNLVWAAAPVIPKPHWPTTKFIIRNMQAEDVTAVTALTRSLAPLFPLSINWDDDSLNHQCLGHSISQSLVAEVAGEIVGMINFHVLPFQAKTIEPVGVIDIIISQPKQLQYAEKLLHAACSRMYDQGAILALKLHAGDTSVLSMLKTNFLPLPPDSYLVLQWTDQTQTIPSDAPVHLLWR